MTYTYADVAKSTRELEQAEAARKAALEAYEATDYEGEAEVAAFDKANLRVELAAHRLYVVTTDNPMLADEFTRRANDVQTGLPA